MDHLAKVGWKAVIAHVHYFREDLCHDGTADCPQLFIDSSIFREPSRIFHNSLGERSGNGGTNVISLPRDIER
jgi:hypothetical protein